MNMHSGLDSPQNKLVERPLLRECNRCSNYPRGPCSTVPLFYTVFSRSSPEPAVQVGDAIVY